MNLINRHRKYILSILCAISAFVYAPSPLYAANVKCGSGLGINTAIGCIPAGNASSFSAFILRWAVGFAGGFAVLLLIYGGFIYLTSAGDPKKTIQGKQIITAAITGLLLLILSVYVLYLFGVQLLMIPALS